MRAGSGWDDEAWPVPLLLRWPREPHNSKADISLAELAATLPLWELGNVWILEDLVSTVLHNVTSISLASLVSFAHPAS